MIPPFAHTDSSRSAIELRTFGGLCLSRGQMELELVLAQPKRAALLCRLALAQDFVRRDLLLPLFWPEADDAHARTALRQAIHFLRRALGEQALISRGDEEIRVNEALVWCDATEFERAIAEQRNEQAFALYRGDFLPGFFVKGAPELDQWLDGERERLRRRAIANAWSLAEKCERSGDAAGAAEYGRAAVSLAPADDVLLRKLMLLLERIGDGAAALSAYEQYLQRIRSEYDLDPPAEVHAVAAGIEERRKRSPRLQPPAETIAIGTAATKPTQRVRNRRWLQIALPTVLLISGAFYMARKGASSPVDHGKEIVLADFANHSRDPNLADGVTEAIRIDLAQSQSVHIADNQRVGAALKRMARLQSSKLTGELAREVAVREGLPAVLQGDVVEIAHGYVINAQLVSADSGRVMLSYKERAARPADVMDAVDRVSRSLRRHMGERLSGIQQSQPLAAVTTSSLDALKAYSAAMLVSRQYAWYGREDGRSVGVDVAARLMQRAIEIDSTFAAAYRSYGAYLYWRGDRTRANEMLTRAFQLRERLTEQERLMTEGAYYSFVRQDADNALATYLELLQINPRSEAALQNLVLLYSARRDWTRAAYYADREWFVHGGAPSKQYINVLFGSGRIERADSFLRYYAPRERTAGLFNTQLIRLEQTRENYRAVDSLTARLQVLAQKSSPAARADAIKLVGSYRIWRGSYGEGAALLREAFAQPDPVTKLTLAFNLARYDVFVLHDAARARRRLDEALLANPIASLPVVDRPYLNLAQAYAFAGDFAHAKRLLQQYETTRTPLNGDSDKHANLFATRAMIEAHLGHAAQAREWIAQGEREIGCSPNAPWLRLGRAMTEELIGDADSTIAAWERFVAPPSCFLISTPDGAYASAMGMAHAHERLAQLYDARGDRKHAAEHYRKFTEIWANPDEQLRTRRDTALRRLLSFS